MAFSVMLLSGLSTIRGHFWGWGEITKTGLLPLAGPEILDLPLSILAKIPRLISE